MPLNSLLQNRAAGRVTAGLIAVAALAFSVYAGVTESMPEFHVYDGLWMVAGTVIAVGLVAPVIWRWRRERSLAAVAVASVIGCWAPLVFMALRHHMPILVRLKGAWLLSGADTVGLTMPVSAAFAWLALRQHTPAPDANRV
jgi:hypothetical protein